VYRVDHATMVVRVRGSDALRPAIAAPTIIAMDKSNHPVININCCCNRHNMPKRKQDNEEEDQGKSESETVTDYQGRVQVDFEFFDPNPDVDFIALKRLITQLFQTDADLLQPHELSELILSQPLVGTTVKTDGKESDPYAFLTVLNIHVHKVFPYFTPFPDQDVSNPHSGEPID
jgi:hypothetical protein